MADDSLVTLDSSLKQHDTKVSSGGTVRAYSHDTGSGPVLCLVHGYPQSAYMCALSPATLNQHSQLTITGGAMSYRC